MEKGLERTLIEKNIQPTAMRLLILENLQKQAKAISLTDLELSLGRTDRVTLYRTIKTFEEQGLVHKIDNGSGIAKFALCQDNCEAGDHQDLHVHFHCTICKETFCLPQIKIPSIELPESYKALETELIVKGRCSKCAG